MAYISIAPNNEVTIFEDHEKSFHTRQLGELLLEFLDLDLNEYDNVFNMISPDNDFYEEFKELQEKYPSVSKRMLPFYWDYFNSDPSFYKKIPHMFLLENDTFDDIYNHPYIHLSTVFIEGGGPYFREIFSQLDWKEVQENIYELIDFCYFEQTDDELNELTPQERYFYLRSSSLESTKYSIQLQSEVYFTPILLYERICDDLVVYSHTISDSEIKILKKDAIQQIKGLGKIELINRCETVKDFAFWEFYTILSRDIPIKRCAYCNKPFIPKGNYDTDCCDRIPEGEKLPCKKLAAIKNRKEKVSTNPILKEYQKAYKRIYARVSSQKMTQEDFRKWTESASAERDKADLSYNQTHDESIITAFKKFLGNK